MSQIPGKNLSLAIVVLLLANGVALAQPAIDQPAENFAVPENLETFKQLVDFVKTVDSKEPEGASEPEVIAHQRKVARTVVAASDQLLSKKISEVEAAQSINFKLQGLRILKQLDEPKADKLLEQTIEAALADKRSAVQSLGLSFLVRSGFSQWAIWNDEQKTQLVDRVIKTISSSEPNAGHVELAVGVVSNLDSMRSNKQAQQFLDALIPHFKSSKQPELLEAVAMLEGMGRRMKLPGNEMKLVGKMLDGSDLDWKSYRGKVVLVDFAATWCPPCRAEVPNVLKMYEGYHDKGFEVLGISLDSSRKEAEAYIEQMNIPWPTMFSPKENERGWKHPMAVYYGVSGIPLAILVDRDGKVVSMLARGENLERELRRLLGEPIARKPAANEGRIQQVSSVGLEE